MSKVIILKLLIMHFLYLLLTWPRYPGDCPPFAHPQCPVSHIKEKKEFSHPYFFKNNKRVFEKRCEIFFDILFVVHTKKKPRMKLLRHYHNISNERTSPLLSLLKSRQHHLLCRTWNMTKSDAKPRMAKNRNA